jgi:hypothetical protein
MIKSFPWGLAIAPFFLIFFFGGACSVTAVRPAQEMSNMEVSIRAAKEVNADVLAPELFRSAQESSLLARREYRYKNFEAAKKYADQARVYAERAEFESLQNGARREAVPADPLSEPSYAPVPIGTPSGDSAPTKKTLNPSGAQGAPQTSGGK